MKKNILKKGNLEGRVEFIRKEEAMFFPKDKDKKYNVGQVVYYKNKAYEVVGRVIEYFDLSAGYYIQTKGI
ncbi:hypothetical protein FP803_05335 [Candidatus Woesearchaeota archaeon]|nr:hypothetical protein [Candidatus Woesearchaeota archaeon]MBU3941879.1 hypothetical protein [Nanoarchaeota archaeon]